MIFFHPGLLPGCADSLQSSPGPLPNMELGSRHLDSSFQFQATKGKEHSEILMCCFLEWSIYNRSRRGPSRLVWSQQWFSSFTYFYHNPVCLVRLTYGNISKITEVPDVCVESIIKARIRRHIDEQNFLRKNQHRFCKRRFCLINFSEFFEGVNNMWIRVLFW